MTPVALSTLGDAAQTLGVIAAALCAAVALIASDPRGRAWGMLGAAVLTPVLLVGHIWSTSQFEPIRDRPAVAVAAGVVALLALWPAARLIERRPAVLAIATAVALPFRVPIESGGTTANLLVPLYLVIAAGAVAYALQRLRVRGGEEVVEQERPRGLVEWLLGASLVLYALQSSYSDDFDEALRQIVFFYVPFALLYAQLVRLPWSSELAVTCLKALLALAVVFVFIGFFEYERRDLLLSPDALDSNQFESYFRVNSMFFDPNIYGRFLVVVILGLTAVLLWTADIRKVLWTIAGLALLMGGLVFTLSQSSFTGLLVGLGVLAALRFATRPVLLVGGSLAAAAIVVALAAPGAVGLDQSADSATSGRSELMEGGVELFADRPIQGYGSGDFQRAYREAENSSSSRAVSASHTIPITVAAEQGVPGLLLYVALVWAALAALWRGARESPARAAVVAAFAAIVAHTLLYAAFLEDPLVWVLLALGAALPIVRRRRERPEIPAV